MENRNRIYIELKVAFRLAAFLIFGRPWVALNAILAHPMTPKRCSQGFQKKQDYFKFGIVYSRDPFHSFRTSFEAQKSFEAPLNR